VIDVGVPTPGVIWELEQARTRRAGRLLVVGRASAAPEVWKIISDPDRARAAAGLAYEVPVLGSAVERFETGFDAWLDCALGGAPLADFEQSPLAITSEQRAAAIAARASAPPPPDEPGETGIAAMRRGRPW